MKLPSGLASAKINNYEIIAKIAARLPSKKLLIINAKLPSAELLIVNFDVAQKLLIINHEIAVGIGEREKLIIVKFDATRNLLIVKFPPVSMRLTNAKIINY